MRRYLTLIGLLVAAFTAGGVLAGDAAALESGDTVILLIPVDANQPDPPNGPQDALIYQGGAVTMIDITGCGSGSHPVQNATLVDPTGGRSGRIEGVITASETDPVDAGTRLDTLTLLETCVIAATGTAYNKYRGTVR